jgi:putative transposon-encoded protein
MANIKIIEKAHEIKGNLKKGNVKPFGNSAHIPFSKEHIGKIVDVIVPDEPLYTWVFDESLRTKLFTLAKKKIEKDYKKDRHYFLSCIEDFSQKEFKLCSLIKVICVLEDDKTLKDDLLIVKKMYQIDD